MYLAVECRAHLTKGSDHLTVFPAAFIPYKKPHCVVEPVALCHSSSGVHRFHILGATSKF